MRPKSIVNFDYAYLGSLLIGLVQLVLTWQETMALESVARAVAVLGPSFPVIVQIVIFGFTLLLWFLTSHRASVVAKWILVIWTSIMILSTMVSLAQTTSLSFVGALVVAIVVLQILAMVLLFRPDARAYFGEGRAAEPVA